MTTLVAITASTFVTSLGVNTHIDFNNYGYQNLATVESALEYLGVKNVRDSAESSTDLTSWQQVAQAAGVKFDDYIPEGSPATMQSALALVPQLAQEGILNMIEGGNEEDDSYAAAQGNTLAITQQFQQQVWTTGRSLGLPVINMSFGAGWTAANNWHGDYDKVGDMSTYATYANAHTYPNPGQSPDSAIQQLNADAELAASSRPVITTEIGWDNATFSQASVAQYVVQATLDAIKDGDVKMYFYSLFDDGSGQFGLMNQNGTAKPAGVALHDLTTLLADTGVNAATFTPGSLTFTLSGNQSTDNTLLIQKSDGSDWLAVWDETATAHNVTVTLASTASQIKVFDPVTGTSAIASASNTNTVTVSLGNDPLLIEVIGAGNSSTNGSGGTSGNSSSGSSSSGSASSTAPVPVVTVPATASTTTNGTIAISGVSIADPWAAGNPGSLVLTVSASAGSISMADASGNKLAGSGTGTIQVSGTLAQLNAELATLKYTAASGSASITVDVWDQAGVEGNKALEVSVSAASSTPPTSGGSSSSGTAASPNPVITVPASETIAPGGKVAISGVSVTDAWAAGAPGTLALNVTATDGTVTMLGTNGSTLTGSGTSAIHISGTLAQINSELATLSYTAGSATGSGSVTVDVWDQGGVEATKSVGVSITKPVTTIAIAASDASPVETVSNAVITASAGDHMIFIGGTANTVTATGGTETVQAYQGHNTITTGSGNDTIRFAGSGNVIDAGGGNNRLLDSGSDNTIVLGSHGGYDDIYGYTLQNGDKFDLRSLLAQTSWKGDIASIGNFLQVGTSGNNGVLSVNPTGVSGGASHLVATFESSGSMNLAALLAHSIT
jgi:serralysin